MASCEQVRTLLIDQMTGTLLPEERRVIMTHVASCASCREEWAQMTLLEREIRAYWSNIKPSSMFVEGLVHQVGEKVDADDAVRHAASRFLRIAVAACLVIGTTVAAAVTPGVASTFKRVLYNHGFAGLTSNVQSTLDQKGRPTPAPLVSREQAQASIPFQIRYPEYLPFGVQLNEVGQVLPVTDGRHIVANHYSPLTHGVGLEILQVSADQRPLLFLDAWQLAWTRSEVDNDGQIEAVARVEPSDVEILPGVQGQWAEATLVLGPNLDHHIGNLLWAEGGVQFFISGPFSQEELLKVARSLR